MLEAQKQQHLRSLRRGINRSVTSLKSGGKVVCHSGWAYGTCFSHPWLEERGSDFPPDSENLYLMLGWAEPEDMEAWSDLIDEGVKPALEYYWPGPLHLRVKLPPRPDGTIPRVTLASPWHPVMQELLARHGPVFWTPLSSSQRADLDAGGDLPDCRVLQWPEPEVPLDSTLLDAATRPWRVLRQGFVSFDELKERISQPLILSQERAFPVRPIQTYVPEGKTVIVEASDPDLLPGVVQKLREQVPPDSSLRIYLDESTAHNHFPDDREVRVYGELSDLERVRRRLQAMLERQNRRLGKRVLLIAVSELGPGSESFRADLENLSDRWLKVEEGKELSLLDPVS